MRVEISDDTSSKLKNLRRLRNHSYIEHGYERIDLASAERLLDHAIAICSAILGDDVKAAMRRIGHLP